MRDELPAPVSFALLLRDNGLSLTDAHATVTKLAAERLVRVTLHPRSLRDLLTQLEALGLAAYAVRETEHIRVLVPAALIPPDIKPSTFKSMSALQRNLSEKTVGDLRQIYGKGFARNYKASAKLSDVLYSMDPTALEVIASGSNDFRTKKQRKAVGP